MKIHHNWDSIVFSTKSVSRTEILVRLSHSYCHIFYDNQFSPAHSVLSSLWNYTGTGNWNGCRAFWVYFFTHSPFRYFLTNHVEMFLPYVEHVAHIQTAWRLGHPTNFAVSIPPASLSPVDVANFVTSRNTEELQLSVIAERLTLGFVVVEVFLARMWVNMRELVI